MTRDFDLVGAMPSSSDKVAAALSSIDDVVKALQAPCRQPPLPPASLGLADRLVAESATD